LFVTDLRRSVEFYRDVVGLRLEMMNPSYATFRFRGCTLSLYEREFAWKRLGSDRIATPPYPMGRTGCFSVEVEDVDREILELERRGATILVRPGPLDRERVAAFGDPDGNLWEVTSIVEEEGP
jgi:catechol 2,3-dioxygenase-like lactoylglutathione lyase family enzyme